MSGQGKLYTPELLACAVRLAEFPLSRAFACEAEARSPACGSTLKIGIDCDQSGRVEALGIRPQACAVGQAAASLFAGGVVGKSREDIAQAAQDLRSWLTDAAAPMPAWPGISLLASARSYPGRHGAIMLPWEAALRALSNLPQSR